MRQKYCFLLILFSLSSVYSLAQTKVKGGYKKCDVYEYSWDDPSIIDTVKKLKNVMLYNDYGDIVEKNEYKSNQLLKTTNVYNSRGKLVETIVRDSSDTLSLNRYKYNDIDSLIENYRKYSRPYSIDSISYKYNIDNKLDTVTHRDQSGKLVSTHAYKYNKFGALIEESVVVEDDGFYSLKTSYIYTDSNKLQEEIITSIGDTGKGKSVSKFNEFGKKFETKVFLADGSLKRENSYQYDERGNEIEEKNTYKGVVIFRTNRKYDENNNVVVCESYDRTGSIISHVDYKYDKYGNMTEEITGTKPKSKLIYIYSK